MNHLSVDLHFVWYLRCLYLLLQTPDFDELLTIGRGHSTLIDYRTVRPQLSRDCHISPTRLTPASFPFAHLVTDRQVCMGDRP